MERFSLLLTYAQSLLGALRLASGRSGSPGNPPPCCGDSKADEHTRVPK